MLRGVLRLLVIVSTTGMLTLLAGYVSGSSPDASGSYIDSVKVYYWPIDDGASDYRVTIWARIRPRREAGDRTVGYCLISSTNIKDALDPSSSTASLRVVLWSNQSDRPLGATWNLVETSRNWQAGGNWLWCNLWLTQIPSELSAMTWGDSEVRDLGIVPVINVEGRKGINVVLGYLVLVLVLVLARLLLGKWMLGQGHLGAEESRRTGNGFRLIPRVFRVPGSLSLFKALASIWTAILFWPIVVGGFVFLLFELAPNSVLIPILLAGNTNFTDFGYGYIFPMFLEGGLVLTVSLVMVSLDIGLGLVNRNIVLGLFGRFASWVTGFGPLRRIVGSRTFAFLGGVGVLIPALALSTMLLIFLWSILYHSIGHGEGFFETIGNGIVILFTVGLFGAIQLALLAILKMNRAL